MKIVYLARMNMSASSGPVKKMLAQVKVWQSLGHEVYFAILTKRKDIFDLFKDLGPVELYQGDVPFLDGRVEGYNRLVKAILHLRPDVVYFRRDLYYMPLDRLLKAVPVVMEVNSNSLVEESITGRKLTYIYDLLTRSRLLNNVAGFVFVTKELAGQAYFSTIIGKKNIPFVVVPNGIDLGEYRVLNWEPHEGISFAFIGSDAYPWHGLDKVVQLAKVKKDWVFHFIGAISEGKHFPANVIMHGELSRLEYEKVFAQVDCGIGTLALHRKRSNEGSVLKVREYLAYGLPVIIGYRDTDFPNGADFILELPNTEDNVMSNIEHIESFILKWRGKRVPRDEIQHLDYRVKEVQRLSFFEEVLKHWRRD